MSTLRPEAVPLTILTGFLGAGKTTLLNHILNREHSLRVGVLVNDFGSINVDAELVVDVEDGVMSLTNGCVCCQIRDDLTDAVQALLDREEPVEYILLEASGVADPSGITMTFLDSKYRDRIRLDSVTCVVDAEQALSYDDPGLALLKLQQIGFSDMAILNKIDLAGVEATKVKEWIDSHLTRVRIVPAVHCDVPLEILLAVGRFDPTRQIASRDDHQHEHQHHGLTFDTWSFETDEPLSLEALREMVQRRLPETVYRCKGIIYTSDAPAQRAILQVVGRRADVALADGWNGSEPRTRIVAIGVAGRLDEAYLQAQFESCVADPLRALPA